jgi:nucleosome binding factor SPN SPT16 subunit
VSRSDPSAFDQDVQFIREVTDAAFDETGNRKRKSRYGDEDEIEQEQEERRKRQQLNKEFQQFAGKIAQAAEDNPDCEFDVDIPFRELAFSGVPFRSNVLLQPTAECLVHLTDSPFLIVTLKEVEVCHLERVQFGLKNFDMVFVFSDFTRAPVHINSIPMEQVDDVKLWLE